TRRLPRRDRNSPRPRAGDGPRARLVARATLTYDVGVTGPRSLQASRSQGVIDGRIGVGGDALRTDIGSLHPQQEVVAWRPPSGVEHGSTTTSRRRSAIRRSFAFGESPRAVTPTWLPSSRTSTRSGRSRIGSAWR